MATYFCNCGDNLENFNLCLKYNIAGFPSTGYKTGDLVYLIVRENKTWKLGAKGILLDTNSNKPWQDADKYKSAFNINWEVINKVDIVDGLREIYPPNFGLAIQGKKDIDTFQEKGNELKNYFNNFFTNQTNYDNINTGNILTESEMNILTAIKTKPFILLAGISGTGKSRLVRTLAYKTCAKDKLRTNPKKPGNFELIPVRPNWHDSSELMGYVSRINGEKYITTSFLQFIAKAWKNVDVPFLLCLDEMNLAPVEQYFAEYLSIIETRQVQGKNIGTDYLISKASFENHSLYSQLLKDLGLDENEFQDGISIPNNLVVIGTVNMDETTHSFSRKVLDRAMTFEMNNVDLTAGLDSTKNDWSYPQIFITSKEVIGDFTSGAEVVNEFAESKKVIDFLVNLNLELEGTPFKIAYRVRDEFLIYCYYASLNQTNSNWLTNALDEMTSMKILSRIEGDETKTGPVLSNLQRVLTTDYIKSNAKLKEMEARLSSSGYTSFWS
jgi:5-methylcytosine-specific restriction protein B